MIIDCHCHAGKGAGLTGPWDTNALLEQYTRRTAQAGIDREVAQAFSLPVLYDPIAEVSIAELLGTEYQEVDFILPCGRRPLASQVHTVVGSAVYCFLYKPSTI